MSPSPGLLLRFRGIIEPDNRCDRGLVGIEGVGSERDNLDHN